MDVTPGRCETCRSGRATVFMVARRKRPDGREMVGKAHVCLSCFELARADGELEVEEVSLPEFKEVRARGFLEGVG